jgi:hypothetical protein
MNKNTISKNIPEIADSTGIDTIENRNPYQ